MSLSLEYLDGCVPVTGLKAVQYGSSSLLLQGQGPFASVIDTRNGQLLYRLRVFRRNNIHGFMVDESRRHEHGKIDILAWGGQSLRYLSIVSHDGQVSLVHETAEYVAPDWIYDISVSHAADVSSVAYAITGHNSLLSIHLLSAPDSRYSRYSRSIRLKRVAAGVKSTLYSANVLALSPSHILIAAGTVFGEIIVWSCFRNHGGDDGSMSSNSSSIHHFFTGHDGSVFGVSISGEIAPTPGKDRPTRLLASCSDDRTVRVWDISDCFDITSTDSPAYLTDGFDLRSTGFGSTAPVNIADGSETAIAKEWGHMSRIWGVYFLPVRQESPAAINLISRGEDATCQLWKLDLRTPSKKETQYDLRNLLVLNQHVGKHIWSLSMTEREHGGVVIYTGGGDGGITVFELDYYRNVVSDSTTLLDHSPYNSRTIVQFAHSLTDNGNLPKLFAFVSKDSLITVSDSGAVQVGTMDTTLPPRASYSGAQLRPDVKWQNIAFEEDLRDVASVAALPRREFALIGSNSRAIRLYDHQNRTLSDLTSVPSRPARILIVSDKTGPADTLRPLRRVCFVVCYMKAEYVDLFNIEFGDPGRENHTNRVRLLLPPLFGVTVATTFCHDKYLALGGKGGALVIYKLDFQSDTLGYLFSDYRPKTKNILRCILPIDDPEDISTGYILSGGQNGIFSVHRLQQKPNEAETIQLIHQSYTPFPHIEAAYFDAQTGHLMLLGGKGVTFYVWNETTQTQVMALDCGGARRILDFMPNPDVYASGIFAWNQQRALHVLVAADPVPLFRPLRIGSHGRELKSLAVGYTRDSAAGGSSRRMPYIASVGEDTAIRISTPTHACQPQGDDSLASKWGALRCQRVMTHHITGLQQVKWSADGQFLFSSGGREEFFIWRIRTAPQLGLAALREAVCPRESFDLELRVMSFDVFRLEPTTADEGADVCEERFLIALVYSNSTVRVYLYTSSSGSGTFDLLLRGTYSSNCLTEVHFIEVGSTRFLLTGATDGYVAFWPLPEFAMLTSRARDTLAVPEAVKWSIHHSIHASSIKSLETIRLSATCQLVVGGGDDNALSVTTFRLPTTTSTTTTEPVITTIAVPNAHASAITALKILDCCHSSPTGSRDEQDSVTVDIASSGNDQRVKLWRVTIDSTKTVSQTINIALLVNRYCAVADIAAMEVMEMPGADGTMDRVLVVAGVGMELLRLLPGV